MVGEEVVGFLYAAERAEVKFHEKLSVGMSLQLLANRPDIRAAEMEVARTHYALGVTRAFFYPSLILGGTVGFTNNS